MAAQAVPPGSGGSATGARPQTSLGSHPGRSAGQPEAGLPQVSGTDRTSEVATVDRAARSGLGLPAIIAVMLLSLVTAALVRTLITQRRAVVT